MYFTATYYYGIIFSLKGGDYLDIQKIKSPLNELLPLIEGCINNKGCFPLTVTGTSMLWEETTSGLTGLLLLVPYYCILYFLRDKLKKRFIFTLKKLN